MATMRRHRAPPRLPTPSPRRHLADLRRIGASPRPTFRSEEKWRARGLLAAIVALNLGAVYMLVLTTTGTARFYDALQNKNQAVFWRRSGVFSWHRARPTSSSRSTSST